MALTVLLDDAEDTDRLGQALGRLATPGTVLRLRGPLGAGKTTLVQGVARGLGIDDARGVRSPSFALVRVHDEGRLPLVHVDLYRLDDPDELLELGLEEWLDGEALVAVEWFERFPAAFGDGGVEVSLRYRDDDDGRDAALEGVGEAARTLVAGVAQAWIAGGGS